MYTNTLFLYFSDFSKKKFILCEKKNKAKLKSTQTKNMLNKAMLKTRRKCMRKKEKKEKSIHGDDTNVLAKEFKPFAIKRFGKQTSLVIIIVNELKSKSTIFNKLLNEVMSNLYVFSLRMLNRILIDVYGTAIVAVDGA